MEARIINGILPSEIITYTNYCPSLSGTERHSQQAVAKHSSEAMRSIRFKTILIFFTLVVMHPLTSVSQSLGEMNLGSRSLELVSGRAGIPGVRNHAVGTYGERIWDLEEYKGRIYIGLGDWNLQSGPQPIVYYNPAGGNFVEERMVNSDAIVNYKRSNGYLFAPHTDECGTGVGTFDWQGPDNNNWYTAQPHSGGMHCFDATRVADGRFYVVTGSSVGAQVRSSSNYGASWDMEYQTTELQRFKYINSDVSTIFVTSETSDRSWAKQNGQWFEVNTIGSNPWPFTLNGTMKMLYGSVCLQLSGRSLEILCPTPYIGYSNQIYVAQQDGHVPFEVLYAVSTLSDGNKEIYATTDFKNWKSVLTLAEQQSRGIASIIRNAWCIAYYANSLYVGMTTGDLYKLSNVYDLNICYANPSKIEAESFTNMSGMQAEPCVEGGLNMGYANAGDWLDYCISPDYAGRYKIECRVASGASTGSFELRIGSKVVASLSVANTGGWQSWQTITSSEFSLAAGKQTLRIYATGNDFNINHFTFKQVSIFTTANAGSDQELAPSTVSAVLNGSASYVPSGTTATYLWKELSSNGSILENAATPVTMVSNLKEGTAYTFELKVSDGTLVARDTVVISKLAYDVQNIPGKIEAENYYSMQNIILDNCSDEGGGKNIGAIDANDLLIYKVNVEKTGVYKIDFRIASVISNAKMELFADNTSLGVLTIPSATGGYQTWQSFSMDVNLQAGAQTLRFVALTNGFNLNWMEFAPNSLTTSNNDIINNQLIVSPNPTTGNICLTWNGNTCLKNVEILDMMGNVIIQRENPTHQILIDLSFIPDGIYTVVVVADNEIITKKIVKQ